MADTDRPKKPVSSSKKPPMPPPDDDSASLGGDSWSDVSLPPPPAAPPLGDAFPELDDVFSNLSSDDAAFPEETTGVGEAPLDSEGPPSEDTFFGALDIGEEVIAEEVSIVDEGSGPVEIPTPLPPTITAAVPVRAAVAVPLGSRRDNAADAAKEVSAAVPAPSAAIAAPRPAPSRVAAAASGPVSAPTVIEALRSPPPSPPPPADDGEPSLLNDNTLFRQEAQRLARARDWVKLAAITSAAVDNATWAHLPETRAALLVDLAKIHRDRLNDPGSAEDTFRRLVKLDPSYADAIDYLSGRYRERGDWRALYDLYAAAIEPTWDPNQRLAWTRETVAIATEKLGSTDLAIESWERLWRLGDAIEETSRALSEVYRRAGRWDRLAEYLAKRAASLQGAERVVALREIAEAYLSGLRDQDRAATVLEQILAERPDDAIALLALARVLARRKDWEALAELGARPLDGLSPTAVLDFRRLVADALWSAGDLDRALIAHERVLALDPEDADSLKAKEDYLDRAGKPEALVHFLADRADRAGSDEERARLLGRAAELAEKSLDDPRLAVSLWERRATIEAGRIEALQSLAHLYETLGDLAGVARSLEGQLALTRQPSARVELLRKLGDHAAHRLGDDVRAEACWKEIASLVPDDQATREELIGLHRRRGDFEALDRTLSAQAWRAIDDGTAHGYWRAAAANIEENIADPQRAARAWLRVIDLSAGDEQALHALVGHQRTLGRNRELLVGLEAELRATSDGPSRTERALEIARMWESEGARPAALASYERVLRWHPTDAAALAAVTRLRAGTEASAFDAAASSEGASNEARIALVRQGLALLDPGDTLGRFFGLRRILWLSNHDPKVIEEVARAAVDASAWIDLVAVYLDAAAEATDEGQRAWFHRELASIYEQRLQDPVRAFLVLLSIGHRPVEDAGALEALARLSEATRRHEDLLAILDVAARAGGSLETRCAALRRRATLCEQQLGDPVRAFHECVRLLALDARDAQALADARRLAEAKQLWRPLDALYAELSDRAATVGERIELARARHAVRADKLGDATGALDQLLLIYRLDPTVSGLEEQLHSAADTQKAWDRVLPLLEARVRSLGEAASPDELSRLAALHDDKRGDHERAFELYAEAFVLRPSWNELKEKLERLAEVANRFDLLALCYRIAAARSGDPLQRLDLYGRITEIYATRLARPADALDVHRRILQLQPAPKSLEVVIEHDRAASNWRELRDRLQQWLDRSPQDGAEAVAARIPRWLEIARLSRERLGDPETALATYTQILEVDAGNEEALQGVRSLTEGPTDPSLELRRLRIELKRATTERRVEIQLACARIQEEQIEDVAGATATLRSLITEAGAAGPGFEPLARLYRAGKLWSDLIDLIEARGAVLVFGEDRVVALEQAVAVCDEHPQAASTERKERLYRRLLEERPGDGETRRHLLALYRDAGRFDDQAQLLRATWALLPTGTPSGGARAAVEADLARVLDRALGKLDDAEAILAARAKKNPDETEVLLGLASLKLRRGDFQGYLVLREQHARRQPASLGAYILCHLAEACDEQPGQQAKVANYYREARTLDPTNPPALEALKAIGRRAKSWRATAAMLPDPDEMKLGWPERAARLRERGEKAHEPSVAQSWLLRSVAVDPDHYLAWDALARVHAGAGDHAASLDSQRASLAAFERSTGPETARLREHAARIQHLAEALRTVGDDEGAARESLRAYQLLPVFAAAALAVADQRLSAGETEAAYAIYDRVLRDHEGRATGPLSDGERLHATFQRGALAARLGKPDQAIADLREGLRIEPLHPGVLNALADALAEKGRVAAAIQHYIQALLVVYEHPRRGQLYARLGRLWEDRLGQADEAGVCYDLAVSSGPEPFSIEGEGDLMVRALRHYRRVGKSERALAVIERLLPSTTDPRELASLWTERGGILAATDEERAIEAFDMALSYDPGAQAALAGLSELLERRGDWEQLLQIFEARTESGGPEERAEALRSLARIASTHLNDPVRTERYLTEVIALAPRKEDYEQLLVVYGDDPSRAADRRAAIAGLLTIAGPWMPRVIELARMLAATGDRRWAWCILSPLMNATMPDPTLKSLVLELRKEVEKSDHTGALTPEPHQAVRHPDVDPTLLGVIAELNLVPLGRTTPEQHGATGVGKLDERTAVGKTFAGIAARLGLEGAVLWRAQELGEPYAVLDTPTPNIVVRAELLQLLSVAETSFLFATLLEQGRRGPRLLGALAPEDRPRLVPALLAAVGLGDATPEVTPLMERIRSAVDGPVLAGWADQLRPLPAAATDGARFAQGIVETARRVGLIAAADLRFVARLLTRLDDTLPKLQTVGKIDDLDDFIGGVPAVRTLLGFAATDHFGKHM
ncbi:MAG: hypothetical protein EXR72_13550 [Myxococcales bacterium]|nr:hypothetical protein [Myxococcales bacterium]